MRKSAPDTKRQLWTSADLAALLSTPPWTSEKTRIDDPVYWAPLIARLHALRSEEILQLKPADVKCDDGIHYFDIARGTGQSLKSQNARRLVPLHSQLIELGFLTLVELQRKRGATRIFDRAKRSKTKRLSFTGNFTKTFNYRRRTNGIYDPRKDLHGLRTTFHQKMADALVPDTARRYLMGHRNDDVGITNYLPEGFALATLKQCIERQRIDLSMVTRRFSETGATRGVPRLAAKDGVAISA